VADLLDPTQTAALDTYRAALARVDEARGRLRDAQAALDAADSDDREAALAAVRAGESTTPPSLRPDRQATRDQADRCDSGCDAVAAEALNALAAVLVPACEDILMRAWSVVDGLGDQPKPARVERAATAVLWALGLRDGPHAPALAPVTEFVLPDRAAVEAEVRQRQSDALDAVGQRVAASLAEASG
jgi:hypothetical protein